MAAFVFLLALVACDDDAPPNNQTPLLEPACKFPNTFVRNGQAMLGNGMPYPIVSDPFVIKDDDQYRLWFTTSDWSNDAPFYDGGPVSLGTSSTTSRDGVAWDQASLAPSDPKRQFRQVIKPGAWNADGVETVTLAQRNAELFLYFTGDIPGGQYAIGLARSQDNGLTWQTEDAPVLTPELAWEKPSCTDPPACTQTIGGVLEPSVIYDGQRFHLWYSALGVLADTLAYRMGHATSTDGLAWQHDADPIFTAGAAGSWDDTIVSHTDVVADPVVGFHLFYFGASLAQATQGEACTLTPGSIGHAYSADGITWQRNPSNPLLQPGPAGAFDGSMVGGPAAVFVDGALKLWYFGSPSCADDDAYHFAIGSATADCD